MKVFQLKVHFFRHVFKFFRNLIDFLVECITGEISEEKVHYCERFLELMIDLEALLLTRRFFNVVLDDVHLVVRCKLAPLNRRVEGKLFSQVRNHLLRIKM